TPAPDAPPHPIQEARRFLSRSSSPQGLRVLRGQDGPDRLQGGQPPPPLSVRTRQDRTAPQDRHVRRAPARAGRRPQARPSRRAAPIRATAPPPLSRVAVGGRSGISLASPAA